MRNPLLYQLQARSQECNRHSPMTILNGKAMRLKGLYIALLPVSWSRSYMTPLQPVVSIDIPSSLEPVRQAKYPASAQPVTARAARTARARSAIICRQRRHRSGSKDSVWRAWQGLRARAWRRQGARATRECQHTVWCVVCTWHMVLALAGAAPWNWIKEGMVVMVVSLDEGPDLCNWLV